MKSTIIAAALILNATVEAQTPANFTVVTDVPLLAYSSPSNTSLEPPSILLPPSGKLPCFETFVSRQEHGS